MGHTAARQPIRIAVDGRSLNRAHVRGIGRYLLRILQAPATPDQAPLHWTVYGDRPDLPVWIEKSEHVDVKIFECRGDRFQAWEQIALPVKAWLGSANVLFCPAVTGPAWQPLPTVITVHDVIPWLMHEESLPKGFYRDRVVPRAFRAANALIVPSANSGKDLVTLWPSLERKLHVIPNGLDDAFLGLVPGGMPARFDALGIREPYVLYVGGEIARKRLKWALDVWHAATNGTVHFVACGINAHDHEAFRGLVPDASRQMVHFAPFIPDEEMPAVYSNAAALLYPTLYEGFGFPVVEAQACGTPVLMSAVGSLAQLIGPTAHVLPVDDRDAWISACRDIVQRRCLSALRAHEPSREWARQFSWQTSVQRHIEVISATALGQREASDERGSAR